MAVGIPPSDVSYHESTDYSWTEEAFEMLERGGLQGEIISSDEVVRSRLCGHCPRCQHPLDDRQTHTAITNLMGGEYRGAGAARVGQPAGAGVLFFPVDVSCGCGESHPGAPAGKTGCGVSFRIELPLQLAGSIDQA